MLCRCVEVEPSAGQSWKQQGTMAAGRRVSLTETRAAVEGVAFKTTPQNRNNCPDVHTARKWGTNAINATNWSSTQRIRAIEDLRGKAVVETHKQWQVLEPWEATTTAKVRNQATKRQRTGLEEVATTTAALIMPLEVWI